MSVQVVQVVPDGCVSPGTPVVAAIQMELSASQFTMNAPGGNIDISTLPITFYGKTYTWVHVKMANKVEICFKNAPTEDGIDCMMTNDGVASANLEYNIRIITSNPRPQFVNIKTDGLGYLHLKFRSGATKDDISTKVGGTVMDTWRSPAGAATYRDLSGCRGSGGAVMPGSEMPNLVPSAEPCSVKVCSLSAVTACGPEEVCQADNT
ncbi:hypothetical protein JOQ06_007895 [Pogonophryne albipinna]|uniref:Uncharacterized protein n=1 Tax=Pogonophryne albipinna TaxID=1090488 RepID=A0AAD6A6C4_9TELE|nr:hypothetical protein JOQ06_007895 [Pogonophryne albipinna]